MKKLLAVPALALALAGCQALAVLVGSSPALASLIEWTRYVCQFEPIVEDAIRLLNVDWPALTTTEAIAREICAEVAPPLTMEASPGGWFVRGVEIRGEFI